MNTDNALSVSQLNRYIKILVDSDEVLSYVTLRGEISNFKYHSSGHLYFTLKDDLSEISAVMFKGSAAKLNFKPANGKQIIAYGRVSVYEAGGKYQLYVNTMLDGGSGVLYAEYVRLLEKLRSEGLFDESKKRPLPKFPRRIGIITSPTGAAVRDMINVTGRRFPSAELVICPSSVQGATAPAELVRALALLNAVGGCDVIIIGRGGGSAEDLWSFNNEELARAVAASSTPIISAVGHETDTTLCDFAADRRAPTPSAAAEIAVPDRTMLLQWIDEKEDKLVRLTEQKLLGLKEKLRGFERQLALCSPEARLSSMKEKKEFAEQRLDVLINKFMEKRRLLLSAAVDRLEAINPLAVLGRGYSVSRLQSGDIISSVGKVEAGDKIELLVRDGVISATVTDKKGN